MKSIDKKITEVSYGRTINVGNYESVRIDFTARVDVDDDWKDVLEDLQCLVLKEEKKVKANKY